MMNAFAAGGGDSSSNNMKQDQVLVTALKNGSNAVVIKDTISMGGANINTNLANCLILCMKNIKNDRDNFNFWQSATILLESGISMKHRLAAIEATTRAIQKMEPPRFSSEASTIQALNVFKFLIEKYPHNNSAGDGSFSPNMIPTDMVASSTKKAWSSLLFSATYSDVMFVFKNNNGTTTTDNSNNNSNSNKKKKARTTRSNASSSSSKDSSNSSNQTVLYAHKNILAASSTYFDRCFNGEWGGSGSGSSNGNGSGSGSGATNPNDLHHDQKMKVFETSNSIEMMKVVLTFIYTGEIPSQNELDDIAGELLAVSGEYFIDDLQTLAVETLKRQLRVDTIKDIFGLANLHNSESLKKACGQFVQNNAAKILFDEEFLKLKEDHYDLWMELHRYVN